MRRLLERKLFLAAVATLVIVLCGVSGCGGGEDEESGGLSVAARSDDAKAEGGSAGEGGSASKDGSASKGGSANENDSESVSGSADGAPESGAAVPSENDARSDGRSSQGEPSRKTAAEKGRAEGGKDKSRKPVNSGAPEEQASSKAEFVAQANAICARTTEQVQAELKAYLAQNAAKEQEKEVFAGITNEIVAPALDAEIEEIRALGVPPGDEAELEAIFATMQEVLAGMSADPLSFIDTENPFEESERRAEMYGIGACGGL